LGINHKPFLWLIPNSQPVDGYKCFAILDSFKPLEGIAKPDEIAGEWGDFDASQLHQRKKYLK
jgi:hypothetical protein